MGELTNLPKVDEALPMLTKLQRIALASFKFSWTTLTVGDLMLAHKDKKNLSEKTIRRALAKLCDIGLITRIPGAKKGRGYSNLYRMREEE